MTSSIDETLIAMSEILVEHHERLLKLESSATKSKTEPEKPVTKTVEAGPQTFLKTFEQLSDSGTMSDIPPWSFDIRKLIPDEVKQRCPETEANIVLWQYHHTSIADWKWTGIQLLRTIGAGDYGSAQRAVDYACEQFNLTDKQWNSIIRWVIREVKPNHNDLRRKVENILNMR